MSEQNNFNAETQSRGDTERALAALAAARAALETRDAKVMRDRKCPAVIRDWHRAVAIAWDNWLVAAGEFVEESPHMARGFLESLDKLIPNQCRVIRARIRDEVAKKDGKCHRLEAPGMLAIVTELRDVVAAAMEEELAKDTGDTQ